MIEMQTLGDPMNPPVPIFAIVPLLVAPNLAMAEDEIPVQADELEEESSSAETLTSMVRARPAGME